MLFRESVLSLLFALLVCTAAYAYDARVLSEIPVNGNISALAVNSLTDRVIAASKAGKTLAIIDSVSHSVVLEILLPATPSALEVHKRSNRVIVATEEGILLFYDLKTGAAVGALEIGAAINALAIDEAADLALLGVETGLMMVDLNSSKISRSLKLSGAAVRIAAGQTFAAVVTRKEAVSALTWVSPSTGEQGKVIPLTGEVASLAVDESLGYILVTQTGSSGLMLFDSITLERAGSIPTGKGAEIVAVNSSTHTAVLAHPADGSLYFVDLERMTVLDSMQLFEGIGALSMDTARNRALVGHGASLTLLQLENQVPVLAGIVPKEGEAGDNDLLLSVFGDRFVMDSQAIFNGWGVNTLFDTNELLRAAIPPEQLAYPGDVAVSVTNPPPGGGVSNEVKFRVLTPVPQLKAIDPGAAVVASPFTLRVEGKNFLPSAVINLGGRKLPTRFVSSIILNAQIDGALIKDKGKLPISVTNSGQTTFTSNALDLQVISADETAQTAKGAAEQEPSSQGFGSLAGRILNTEMQPLQGVTVSTKGLSVRTDAQGKFILANVPAGRRTLLIDGSTAAEKNGHYPTIPISVDIEAGVDNVMPFNPYFHRQKNRNFVHINPAQDTVLTDPEVPGFEMRIPAGVRIIGWDGKVNLKVSVRTVATDSLPVRPLPQNAYVRTVYMFYFNKIGGGKPDQPIPMKAPNDLGLLPGEKAVLWYYDESHNEGEAPNDWAIAGTGTVSDDGRFIESDPGVGLPKFCCGAAAYGGTSMDSPPSGPCGGCCDDDGGDNNAGDPVNVATGYFMHEKTDYRVNGIIPVELKRFYRSGDAGLGAFGRGTYFGYDLWLGVYSDMLLLLRPGNYQYRFYKQTDGTFINTTDPNYRGDVFYANGDNTYTLRKRDGVKYKFGTDRLLDQITDASGNAVTFLKEVDGNISKIILPDGREIVVNYVINGGRDNLTSITGPLGTVTYAYYVYGSSALLRSVTYPDGGTVSYTYDASGRMATVTENGKLVVTNLYDENNRISSQTHPDGGQYAFSYNLAGGYVTQTTMSTPNGAAKTWRFYDDNGAYHGGYIVKNITSDGITTSELEPGTNLIRSVTDPLGRKTSYSYDAKGRRVTVTDPISNTTGYQYEDNCSNVATITDPLGKNTTFGYVFAPGTCRKTRMEISDPLQNLTVVEYNTYGMPTKVTDPNGNPTTLTYAPDHPEAVASVSDALGNTLRYSYDTLGRLVSTTDAKGAKSTYVYQSVSSRLATITDPNGRSTSFAYDTSHNLQKVTDARGNSIQYEYDDRNRITKMTDQLGRQETYAYYRNAEITPTTGDNLKAVTDRKGQTTTFNEYDALSRRKNVTFHDGSYLQYTYDAAGRLTNVYDSISGAVGHTYNDSGCSSCGGKGLDRISEERTPLSTIAYTYDANGRKATMTVAGEPVVTYSYDDAGRPFGITRNVGGIQRSYVLGYDNAGRRASVQVPLASGADFVTTIYGYDIANRLRSMLVHGPAARLEDLAYSYDPNGNRLSFTRSAPQSISPAMTNTNHNAANEMLSFNGKTQTYDVNGNLQTRSDVCGATTYTWDARNRLTGISGFQPDCTILSASFSYDAFGRRTTKTINGTTTSFVYDGLDVIQEVRNGQKVDYVRTLNIDEPLTRITSSSIRHYVRDGLGSVLGLVDDSGANRSTYVYDAFGGAIATGETSENSFGYTARENDGTGLLHYRFRYYSHDMQRFISEDPIRLRGGINFYSYVQNNPIRFIDPLGLEILVCNRMVQGFPFIGNHAYPWDTTTNTAEGMRGSSGSGATAKEKGPAADSCNAVEGSKDKEQEIMDFMWHNQNNGIWFPWINDCHNAVQDAVENSGLNYPGAPGGRFGEPL